jgi:mannose-1-phosphate guanylyltransferase
MGPHWFDRYRACDARAEQVSGQFRDIHLWNVLISRALAWAYGLFDVTGRGQQMMSSSGGSCWALILAGGSGTRLRSLTTTSAGISIPKQFCSLRGGPSLLHEALQRALIVAPIERICVVVAAQHRRWWQKPLEILPPRNVIIQPGNCGTASGILLPLLQILARDPGATIVILPSDHHVDNEAILAHALRAAVTALDGHGNDVLLLGIEPEEADPELGYIVPDAPSGDRTAAVLKFVEKPTVDVAEELIAHGALWNAFIIAGRAASLLQLFERNTPELVLRMRKALQASLTGCADPDALRALYGTLATQDFSRRIFLGQEPHLRVMRVPACGWSDIGTPKRVVVAIDRMDMNGPLGSENGQEHGVLNLAAEHSRRRTDAAASSTAGTSQ